MKIFVKAKPGAREEKVEQLPAENCSGEMNFVVWVKEPPSDGKANRAIEKALAKHFGIPQYKAVVIKGHSSKQKIVEIAE